MLVIVQLYQMMENKMVKSDDIPRKTKETQYGSESTQTTSISEPLFS